MVRRGFGQEGYWSEGILVRRDFGQEGFWYWRDFGVGILVGGKREYYPHTHIC